MVHHHYPFSNGPHDRGRDEVWWRLAWSRYGASARGLEISLWSPNFDVLDIGALPLEKNISFSISQFFIYRSNIHEHFSLPDIPCPMSWNMSYSYDQLWSAMISYSFLVSFDRHVVPRHQPNSFPATLSESIARVRGAGGALALQRKWGLQARNMGKMVGLIKLIWFNNV